jgi:hypothetical protein
MSDIVLVINASPLIFLGNAGRLELLHTLGASRIIVPAPVFDEVIAGGHADRAARAISDATASRDDHTQGAYHSESVRERAFSAVQIVDHDSCARLLKGRLNHLHRRPSSNCQNTLRAQAPSRP